MEQLMTMLKEIRPDVAFEDAAALMDDGLLDSFDIVAIVGEISSAYGITVPVEEVRNENFNSAKAMLEMIERIKAEG